MQDIFLMLLDIKKYGNPVLREKCEEVEEITDGIRQLISDMVETLQQNQGVGLAAPQVGVNKRVIVVDAGEVTRRIMADDKGETLLAMINPKIIKKSGRAVDEEGCLSIPGIYLKIKRPEKIVAEYINKEGRTKKIEVQGLLARVIQHEIDHLDGILITDKINFWQRWKIRNKLEKIKKESM